MLTQLNEQIGTLLWLTACAIALVIGHRPERQVAVILLADLASVELLPQLNGRGHIHLWTAAGDLIVLSFMLAIWRAGRGPLWLTAAIGFQGLGVLAHIPSLFDPIAAAWGYLTVTTFCGYAVVAALTAGALMRRATERADARR